MINMNFIEIIVPQKINNARCDRIARSPINSILSTNIHTNLDTQYTLSMYLNYMMHFSSFSRPIAVVCRVVQVSF